MNPQTLAKTWGSSNPACYTPNRKGDNRDTNRYMLARGAVVAQLVEHPAVNRAVAGSNPADGAKQPRARSLAVERQAHNLVVKGSNPFGPTNHHFLLGCSGSVDRPIIPAFRAGDSGSNPGRSTTRTTTHSRKTSIFRKVEFKN